MVKKGVENMNNKSIWEFLDSQTTKEVKNYIDTHKDYIKSKQNDVDSLACHFCRKNEEKLFVYLIENEICDSSTMKESCETDNCNFLCGTLVIENKTEKKLKEEEFRKEIEQIIKEHKDEFDKLS